MRVNNPLTFDPLTSVFASALYVRAKVNVPADGYSIQLYDSQNRCVKTLSGAIAGEKIDTSWDLTGGNYPVTGPLNAQVSLSNSQGGQATPAAVSEKAMDNEIEYTIDQDFVLAYGLNEQNEAFQMKMQEVTRISVVDILGNPARNDAYRLLPNVNVPLVMAYRQFDTASAHRVLMKAFASGNNFFWNGHGNPYFLGSTGGEDENGNVRPSYHGIFASEVADLLGFSKSSHQRPKRPYRLVILKGCNTYSKPWANAFGISPFAENGRSPFQMQDYIAIGRGPRAFVGWNGLCAFENNPDKMPAYMFAFAIMFNDWMAGDRIDRCMKQFAIGTSGYENNDNYGISGCIDLRRRIIP